MLDLSTLERNNAKNWCCKAIGGGVGQTQAQTTTCPWDIWNPDNWKIGCKKNPTICYNLSCIPYVCSNDFFWEDASQYVCFLNAPRLNGSLASRSNMTESDFSHLHRLFHRSIQRCQSWYDPNARNLRWGRHPSPRRRGRSSNGFMLPK